ncbi:GIY-YIG nuclease family protein [Geojedonia litorea]|uniref:GIY-YIG nuclease family protein n=1 Tax=Geojedonia litorea TaxID=1268269 RepID=A0ABV9N2H0_9FLAO
MKFYFVYILLCADKSYYTGITNNLEYRLIQHQNGLASAYTAKRLPIRLEWHLQCTDPKDAIAIEKQLKGWSRKKKQALIEGKWEDLVKFSKNYSEYGNPKLDNL